MSEGGKLPHLDENIARWNARYRAREDGLRGKPGVIDRGTIDSRWCARLESPDRKTQIAQTRSKRDGRGVANTAPGALGLADMDTPV